MDIYKNATALKSRRLSQCPPNAVMALRHLNWLLYGQCICTALFIESSLPASFCEHQGFSEIVYGGVLCHAAKRLAKPLKCVLYLSRLPPTRRRIIVVLLWAKVGITVNHTKLRRILGSRLSIPLKHTQWPFLRYPATSKAFLSTIQDRSRPYRFSHGRQKFRAYMIYGQKEGESCFDKNPLGHYMLDSPSLALLMIYFRFPCLSRILVLQACGILTRPKAYTSLGRRTLHY